jgi:hypothetical protein
MERKNVKDAGTYGLLGFQNQGVAHFASPVIGARRLCEIEGCRNIHRQKGLCNKHYCKFRKYGDPLAGFERKHKNGEGWIQNGYRVMSKNYSRTTEHRLIAESVFGKKLPESCIIHHLDGVKNNNGRSNLVICESENYHRFLHMRTRAFKTCGHAGWMKCAYCKQYDDPKNMYVRPNITQAWHLKCFNAYRRNNYLKRERG